MPDYNLKLIIPEVFLFLWALFIIAFDLGTRRRNSKLIGYLAMGGVAFTGILLSTYHGGFAFGNMFKSDMLAVFFKVIFLGSAFMAIGSSFGIITDKIKNHRGEFFGLILLSTVGMMFLASAGELITLYIGLELTTIPLFVLAAYYKDDRISVEAGLKYMIIGAFSSAIMLYGLSLLYGLSGTTDLLAMKINLAYLFLGNNGLGWGPLMAIILVMAGIGFKLALVPFHMWAPDVYQGSPTPVTALLSVGSKAAGIVAFLRIFTDGLFGFSIEWSMILAVLATGAVVLGNISALRQKNIKRMLAYSSIAQIGYVMVGLVAVNQLGVAAAGYYMFIYLFANMGAFAVATIFCDKTGSDSISSYAGLSKSSPALSAYMAVFLLSLAGIPPLGGFVAKYFVFAAGIKAGYTWLVIVALLTAVVSLYYYANVIKNMYFSAENPEFKIKPPLSANIVLILGVAGLVVFGVYPEPILNFALDAAKVFIF